MFHKWLKRQMSYYYGNSGEKSTRLYAFGTLEIVLIVLAVVLVFGVGKLGNVGGALGKSIREFRKEKDKVDDAPQLTKKDTKEADSNQSETKSKE